MHRGTSVDPQPPPYVYRTDRMRGDDVAPLSGRDPDGPESGPLPPRQHPALLQDRAVQHPACSVRSPWDSSCPTTLLIASCDRTGRDLACWLWNGLCVSQFRSSGSAVLPGQVSELGLDVPCPRRQRRTPLQTPPSQPARCNALIAVHGTARELAPAPRGFPHYPLGSRSVDSRPASSAARFDWRRSSVTSGRSCSRHVRAMSRSWMIPPRFSDLPVRRTSV